MHQRSFGRVSVTCTSLAALLVALVSLAPACGGNVTLPSTGGSGGTGGAGGSGGTGGGVGGDAPLCGPAVCTSDPECPTTMPPLDQPCTASTGCYYCPPDATPVALGCVFQDHWEAFEPGTCKP